MQNDTVQEKFSDSEISVIPGLTRNDERVHNYSLQMLNEAALFKLDKGVAGLLVLQLGLQILLLRVAKYPHYQIA